MMYDMRVRSDPYNDGVIETRQTDCIPYRYIVGTEYSVPGTEYDIMGIGIGRMYGTGILEAQNAAIEKRPSFVRVGYVLQR